MCVTIVITFDEAHCLGPQSSPGDSEQIAGILYLHRITDNRISGTVVKNFDMFQKLCGENFFSRVLLTTTMWPTPEDPCYDDEEAQCLRREAELKENYWKSMMDLGSTTHRFKPTEPDSAWNILNRIIQTHSQDKWVQIHQELMQGHKIPKTEAGKRLHAMMEDLVNRQNRVMDNLKEELAKSAGQDPKVIAALLEDLRKLRVEREKHLRDIKELRRNVFQKFIGSVSIISQNFSFSH
jgi:hypothetical protein